MDQVLHVHRVPLSAAVLADYVQVIVTSTAPLLSLKLPSCIRSCAGAPVPMNWVW
jgi:hypothetical protein